jgi:hypothetical protein
MHLAKLFLETITKNPSADSVKRALNLCADEMQLRMGNFDDEEETVQIFFGESENLDYVSNAYCELMELGSAYQEYASLLSSTDQQNLWILDMIDEASEIYEYRRNRKLLSNLTLDELNALESLCLEIESIYNAKYIQFIKVKKTGLLLQDRIEMTVFEKSLQTFNYVAIQNQIIEAMQVGGIAYVVAGSIGLTPQRLHGFIVSKTGWTTCPKEFTDIVRDMILCKAKTQ